MKSLFMGIFIIALSTLSFAQEGQGCFFNNQVMPDGGSVTAYQNSTVPFGSQCVSEVRTCSNGALSGSFNFGSCSVSGPASCLFNGQTIADGGSVTTYPSSTVPFGQTCVAQIETCSNGVLSGANAYSTCNVNGPASCLFNGQTIASGDTITAYQNSSVPFGQTCVSQVETCTNGSFDGSFQYATCSPAAPASCLFNGQNVASGQTVTAYQNSTVPFGQTCQSQIETCTNGKFDGTYQYGSCIVDAPASCLFNGQTIPDGNSVVAYPSSTVPYGQACVAVTETCRNGVLSGNNPYSSCTVAAPASCLFNGQTIANGQLITAYQNSTVPYGQTCVSQIETCTNGVLNGDFQYASCSPAAPASCLFNGQTVANGQSVIAYPSSTVPYGQVCISQTELCTNGVLSGNDPYASCTVAAPASCLFNGQTIASGQSFTAYKTSTVPYGQSCVSQVETCTNGTLNGNYAFASCSVGAPAACSFNGQTIASGQTVVTYANSTVPAGQSCVPIIETCTNGVLSGNNKYSSCTVNVIPPPLSCQFNGQIIPNGHSIEAYQAATVSCGKKCLGQQRTCRNGVLTGTFKFSDCKVSNGPTPPPPEGGSCYFDHRKILEGDVVLAFKFPFAFNQGDDEQDWDDNHCEFDWEFRRCHHGKLKGHFQYPSCKNDEDPSGHHPHGEMR